ncbi:hypothetical protein L1049_007099 [Liquidambar formosana]|uniref:WIT1/2 N-terminal helical bundle domain-containing protein n=1 Tax=Liquidambar formosana TaxID=63359 RepID=A0AAP0WS49_LIQFO
MDNYAVENINSGNPEPDKVHLQEVASSDGQGMQELGSAMKLLTRVDLDLAHSSEKLVNLHVLLMHALAWEHDFEEMTMKIDCILEDSIEKTLLFEESIEKALVYDFLSDIFDSEVRDLDNFMNTLQTEIIDARQNIFSCRHLREMFSIMKEKLHDSEESWKQSQEKLLEMKMLSSKLQRASLTFGHKNWEDDKEMDLSKKDQLSNINVKSKMQAAEQRRHSLWMLEKSLARKLDLEKRLLELIENEEQLKLKLHYTEQVALRMEETGELVWGRFLEAENAAEVFMGISKELVGRLQIVQFNLNGSMQRESESKSKHHDCIEQLKAKEAALQKLEGSHADPHEFQQAQTTDSKANLGEVFNLREKVKLLEEQLKIANTSNEASEEKLSMMENIIESLEENISKAESRAESAESKLTLLTETNLELTEELGFLKGHDGNTGKVSLLEKQSRDLEIQLQHAKASSEASKEQQDMLYDAIWDMETLIEDLKSKVSKAESKTETAEDSCVALSETNLELDRELSFMRSRMECLEASLQQANNEKEANAKDISIRSKLVMDMVMQLAVERERIQKQLYSLAKENRFLVEKVQSCKKDDSIVMLNNGDGDDKELLFSKLDSSNSPHTKTSKQEVMESSSKSLQVDEQSKYAPSCEAEVVSSISTTDAVDVVSKLESVKRIGLGQLNLKNLCISVYSPCPAIYFLYHFRLICVASIEFFLFFFFFLFVCFFSPTLLYFSRISYMVVCEYNKII